MIRYSLTCDKGHDFESWFQSAAAYDRLVAAGQIGCALCGSTAVNKALMTPAVRPAEKAGLPAPEAPLTTPQSDLERRLAALRAHIEETSDYVGLSFADEARAMHDGRAPERPIHGEARPDDARRLIEDGIPVAPLPFLPRRQAN
jgi:hypothetical protein